MDSRRIKNQCDTFFKTKKKLLVYIIIRIEKNVSFIKIISIISKSKARKSAFFSSLIKNLKNYDIYDIG